MTHLNYQYNISLWFVLDHQNKTFYISTGLFKSIELLNLVDNTIYFLYLNELFLQISMNVMIKLQLLMVVKRTHICITLILITQQGPQGPQKPSCLNHLKFKNLQPIPGIFIPATIRNVYLIKL